MKHERIILISIYFVLFSLLGVFIFHRYNSFYYGIGMSTLNFSNNITLIPVSRGAPLINMKGNKIFINVLKLSDLKSKGDYKQYTTLENYPHYVSKKGASVIVVIGDSYSAGFGLKSNQTYPYFLNKISSYNVINLGVTGINTRVEVNFLRNSGLKHKPKFVILQYCENDYQETPVFNNLVDNLFLTLKQNDINITRKEFYSKVGTKSLIGKTYLFYQNNVYLKNPDFYLKKNVAQPMSELFNLSNEYNFTVLFIEFGLPPNQQSFIQNIIRKYNWTSLNLDKELNFSYHPPYTISEDNGHFSEWYNKKIAELLKKKIDRISK